MGHLQGQIRNRLIATVRVWAETDYCVMTQQAPRGLLRPAEASTLDAHEQSADDYTAGSQPGLMQWVTVVTDLAGGAS